MRNFQNWGWLSSLCNGSLRPPESRYTARRKRSSPRVVASVLFVLRLNFHAGLARAQSRWIPILGSRAPIVAALPNFQADPDPLFLSRGSWKEAVLTVDLLVTPRRQRARRDGGLLNLPPAISNAATPPPGNLAFSGWVSCARRAAALMVILSVKINRN